MFDADPSPPRCADEAAQPAARDFRFVSMPKGRPSYWIRREYFAPTGEDLEIVIDVDRDEAPAPEQHGAVSWVKRSYLFVAGLALPSLTAEYRRLIGPTTVRRNLVEEFFLVGIHVPAGARRPREIDLAYRARTERAYHFTVTLRDHEAVRIRSDRDS
ncbi:MAG TPA: hypothetical protein VF229_03345 [Burkholderiaceae bacterium]